MPGRVNGIAMGSRVVPSFFTPSLLLYAQPPLRLSSWAGRLVRVEDSRDRPSEDRTSLGRGSYSRLTDAVACSALNERRRCHSHSRTRPLPALLVQRRGLCRDTSRRQVRSKYPVAEAREPSGGGTGKVVRVQADDRLLLEAGKEDPGT